MRLLDGFLFTAAKQAEPWRQAGLISAEQAIYEVLESSTMLRPIERERARLTAAIEGSPSVLWVGRLNATKDPMTVLAGFEKALESIPEAVLTMVYGDEELLPDVQRRISESAALSRSVRLVGRVPHSRMAAFFSAADLFVLGSVHEGSGYALVEACACGVTPVVTDIPSFRAITGNQSIGLLWKPRDAEACARALAAAAHCDLTEGRRHVARHFERTLSWSAVGQRAVAIYEEALSMRRAEHRDR
jgi:glycosyltransferase involved in cell wall biosynthesis